MIIVENSSFLCQARGNRYVTEITNFSLSVVQIFRQRNKGDFSFVRINESIISQ